MCVIWPCSEKVNDLTHTQGVNDATIHQSTWSFVCSYTVGQVKRTSPLSRRCLANLTGKVREAILQANKCRSYITLPEPLAIVFCRVNCLKRRSRELLDHLQSLRWQRPLPNEAQRLWDYEACYVHSQEWFSTGGRNVCKYKVLTWKHSTYHKDIIIFAIIKGISNGTFIAIPASSRVYTRSVERVLHNCVRVCFICDFEKQQHVFPITVAVSLYRQNITRFKVREALWIHIHSPTVMPLSFWYYYASVSKLTCYMKYS